ncbi:MAG: 8-amino-7-oxononanoate synthase [Planctomycetota bacterium]|jgi:8-amino-7-oxononanoate synthase|nr:8-amino-7-oxononanoate synthase [Planctomycetota bacterium]
MTEARARRRQECAATLAALSELGRLRERPVIDAGNTRLISLRGPGGRRKLVNWASNDYLALVPRLTMRNAAIRALRRFGTGSGAARLLSGGLACHARLEQRLAAWFGHEAALLTTTGYQVNLAVLTSLAEQRGDVIILDRLSHASSYDGARLAEGRIRRFAHNDVNDLVVQLRASSDARRRIVCIESVYSMDGDEAPLVEIAAACAEHDAWLLVDEAHGIGPFGPSGRGRCAELGVMPDLLIGTCSKTMAAQGGFVCGDREVIECIVNRGRSFIFSTAASPAASGAAVRALDHLRDEPDLGATLCARSVDLRARLRAQGWDVPAGRSPIIPILIGSEHDTLALATRLREAGHYAPAIRPPTVPEGQCRLRLTLTLAHKEVDVRRLLAAMGSV